jgi:hypothetical protein
LTTTNVLAGDDLHGQLVVLNITLDSTMVHPDVVGVEVLEGVALIWARLSMILW